MVDQNNNTLQDFTTGVPAGIIPSIQLAIISGNRLRNGIIKNLVKTLRKEKFSDTQLLNFILELDAKIESGEMTNDELDKFIKTSFTA